MGKVEILVSCRVDGKHAEKGSKIDVSATDEKTLIAMKRAKKVDGKAPAKKEK